MHTTENAIHCVNPTKQLLSTRNTMPTTKDGIHSIFIMYCHNLEKIAFCHKQEANTFPRNFHPTKEDSTQDFAKTILAKIDRENNRSRLFSRATYTVCWP